jgi:hypothetical protein
MSDRIVQSLWIGQRLSTMERLTARSFLANGHEFHLYCYNDLENVPAGVVLKNAADILPADRVFAYRDGFGRGSWSAFSNFFRYKLLLDRGGWWVDTDVVCLQPFDFPGQSVLASEHADPNEGGGVIAASNALKQPPASDLMAWTWRACEQKNPDSLRWGEVGPRLLQTAITTLGWQGFVEPPSVFSPVPFYEWRALTDPRRTFVFSAEVRAVHLWHQMWREHGMDPDGRFPDDCLYERLKRQFLIE